MIVIYKSTHQPERLISCNLLADTEKLGIKVITEAKVLIGVYSSSIECPKTPVSIIIVQIPRSNKNK